MAGITVLADDVRQLADALDSVDAEFTAAARALRDLTPEDVGPPDVAAAMVEVLSRLQRRLGALAAEAGDGGRAVRRHLDDLDVLAPAEADDSSGTAEAERRSARDISARDPGAEDES
jgi:hypothetical protein